MKSIQQLNAEREQKQTKLMQEVRLFWAFSNDQLREGIQKIQLQEGEKIVSIGAGGYLPKGNVDTFINGMEQITKEYKAAIKSNKLRVKLIAYQLANHECYYTGDIEPALYSLGDEFTRDEVIAVYRANFKQWQKINA
jgi:hypothetical protein